MTKKNSGMAVASLVLGLCSLFLFWTFVVPILAIVFGFVGLNQIKHNKNLCGKDMAIWGICLGGFWFVLLIIMLLGSLPKGFFAGCSQNSIVRCIF